ncbi:hypothetical protein NDU88_009537 [Pleurodeles waltl]|uniref:Uncharacterized protein n=1 Tax=Pleurodeles waltl TaxID=8319 RepID=A0AAV7P490_PLEWA|nr:hypothetical protein NDU88_009537 [Pleurodeles waltl]
MVLRNLGTGKKTLEQRIQEEARHMVKHFTSQQGRLPGHYGGMVGWILRALRRELAELERQLLELDHKYF